MYLTTRPTSVEFVFEKERMNDFDNMRKELLNKRKERKKMKKSTGAASEQVRIVPSGYLSSNQ
jgi:hypothetical protein